MEADVNSSQIPLAGKIVSRNFSDWPESVRADFVRNKFNGAVGSELLSENDRVRVWKIDLAPGERWNAHRHVLDYFWTAVTPGESRQHVSDGTTREVNYRAGETRHFTFNFGEYLLHDIQNIGAQDLVFITVEHMGSANPPLPLT